MRSYARPRTRGISRFALTNISSTTVIQAYEKVFQMTGYPERICSDNGRQFVSAQAVAYLTSKGIIPEKSSPEFPSSNGHAEAAVKSIKRQLKKSKSKSEFKENLAELNRQPRSDGNIPADVFLRRHVRGNMPKIIPDPNSVIRKKVNENKPDKMGKSHELAILKLGDKVRVQNPKSKLWDEKAKVIGIMKYDRSYLIENCENNRVSRKNRRFLRPFSDIESELTEQRESSPSGLAKRDKYCSQPDQITSDRQSPKLRRSSRLQEKKK